jgi:hypothetical protein
MTVEPSALVDCDGDVAAAMQATRVMTAMKPRWCLVEVDAGFGGGEKGDADGGGDGGDGGGGGDGGDGEYFLVVTGDDGWERVDGEQQDGTRVRRRWWCCWWWWWWWWQKWNCRWRVVEILVVMNARRSGWSEI